MSLNGKKALVTGASSGIGWALVKALVNDGVEVLALARRAEALAKLADETGCQILVCDLQDITPALGAIDTFAPDILVNNAGTGHGITGLTEITAPDIAESVSVNVVAPAQLTAHIAGRWKRDTSPGHIVNIGSIAGIHTGVSSLYGAGKAAIHLFSQNLRVELRGYPIRVTEICPGRTSTGFYGAAKGDRQKLDKVNDSGITELRPEDVADSILFALRAPGHVNVSTIEVLPLEQTVGGVTMTPQKSV